MAELSTIARPYAQGLWKALADRGDTAQAAEIEQSLFALSSAVSEPQVAELVSDPKVTDDQMYDLLAGSIGEDLVDFLDDQQFLAPCEVGSGKLSIHF